MEFRVAVVCCVLLIAVVNCLFVGVVICVLSWLVEVVIVAYVCLLLFGVGCYCLLMVDVVVCCLLLFVYC